MSKVVIATGGTGGHIYPAIVIGEYLRDKGVEVVFTGRKQSTEENLIKKYNFNMHYIEAKKYKGVNLKNKFITMFQMIVLIYNCMKIIKQEKPQFVIGTGGYVAAPVIIAAAIMRVKTGICEQNALMGFGNRVLSLFVNYIFLSFRQTYFLFFKHKAVITGNFIRKEFLQHKEDKNENRGILVFGGSQGARKINNLFCELIEKLEDFKNLKIYHITGKHDYEKVYNSYKQSKLEYEVYEYYDNIYEIFKKVQLIICRAGATSISEIIYTGKRAILIPYPYAADNHQWYNAIEFCKTGKGVVLKESYLDKETLFKWVTILLEKDRFKSNIEVLGDYREGLKKIYSLIRKNQVV